VKNTKDIFDKPENNDEQPLAEKMRPRNLDEFIGQRKVVGPGSLIRSAIENDRIFSMILWGPPGCGKTTLARIMAQETKSHFIHFSAVLSGVKDIRAVIEEAKKQQQFQRKTILFVDEIHRFNKAQQDAFLYHVETGLITLIGATTENPSFEVISPLLSRCRVITFQSLSEQQIAHVMDSALKNCERELGATRMEISPEAFNYLIKIADGDARVALNNLEAVVTLRYSGDKLVQDDTTASCKISLEDLEKILQKKALLYDKTGDEHFNLISAFHKSLRGSDPDAALYWMCRMLLAGEDPLYVARRMVRFASEDVGNADPHALTVAVNAMSSFRFLGFPEGELALAQAAVYLATAPKSNSIYVAYKEARKAARNFGALPVPYHLRNAPTRMMKEMGYGKHYKYAHDYDEEVVFQEYLPEKIQGNFFYFPTSRGYEKIIKQRLDKWRALLSNNKKPLHK
jgi:putative ATPase